MSPAARLWPWTLFRIHPRGRDVRTATAPQSRNTALFIVGVVTVVGAAALMLWPSVRPTPLILIGVIGAVFIAVVARGVVRAEGTTQSGLLRPASVRGSVCHPTEFDLDPTLPVRQIGGSPDAFEQRDDVLVRGLASFAMGTPFVLYRQYSFNARNCPAVPATRYRPCSTSRGSRVVILL